MTRHDSHATRLNREANIDRAWWKESVVYQIYPRSFNDSDGTGVGDISGITEKAGYLDELGVDVVWLCPVYGSPNADNGYDIRDYRSIMGEFGTMADWEALRDALHERDIRLIMDLVVNHTSKQHEWFQRSRRREDGYEDYYHWQDGDPDEPPNNWQSIFGGPAWSYDEERGQWYLHLFDPEQPDLNWRNPAVRDAVADVVTWWLEKGIDGFRLDAIDHLSKADGFPDGDPDEPITGLDHFSHGPRLREYLDELATAFEGYDTMTVGEMGGADIEQVDDYTDAEGLNTVFQFEHMGVTAGPDGPWDPEQAGEWALTDLKEIIDRQQDEIDWPALFFGNHDQPRLVSHFGDDEAHREESAKLVATFLLTLRGTPYIYQGEEIGMTNDEFSSLDELDDPMTVGIVEELLEAGAIDSYDDAADLVNRRSRDHARTPMHWSDEPNAGFTDGNPWFAINENYTDINVESSLTDPDSVWNHYRRLIDLRHDEDALVYGEYEDLLPDDEQLYAYTRTLGDERMLVVLNWSDDTATVDSPVVDTNHAEVVLSNYDGVSDDPSAGSLEPYEATVYRIDSA
ncbi:alpha amylase [Haloferax prahovense DSM 18310]|uniref:Alpha amylase n=1 Tax=Haloferax prahovense (strain DSM 18310 / JCM 13924 / TL6) TaxID=1227461 RepID=M0G0V1_HALPT|nr:alpha-glucosidase [Haloferax prahovense]ELZ65188.1 alpha amylase [Haloferax prahovense DSM 18310]